MAGPLRWMQHLPAEQTSVEAALAHLTETNPCWPAGIRYGVFDGWYSKEEFVTGVVNLGLQMIGKLRSDARLRYLFIGPHTQRRGRGRKFLGPVDLKNPLAFAP